MVVNSLMVTYGTSLMFGNNPEEVYAPGGNLAEVGLWNVAPTQTQIQNTMSKVVRAGTTATTGLAGYWRLDEGKGDIARDRGGYGNKARLGTGVGTGSANPTWTRDVAALG